MNDDLSGRAPGSHTHDHDEHDCHEHDHGDLEGLDPRIVGGWAALEDGDVQTARHEADAVLSETPPGEKAAGGGEAEASRLDALLLKAACAREEGEGALALETLQQAAKEDPEWCTPELWMAELISEDAEQLDQALRHARRALDLAEEEDEYLDALRCKATIELDLERPTEARKTLSGLPPADVPLDDPSATLDFAQLLMDAGAPEEARVRIQALVDAAPPDAGAILADAWYLLGAAAEQLGDEDVKREAWLKTRALDMHEDGSATTATGGDARQEQEYVGGRPAGLRLSEDELVAIAEHTLTELPPVLSARLTDVPIVVAEVPAQRDVAQGADPRVLGFFSGTPYGENAGILEPATLNQIVLFRKNIERFAVDEASLRAEVRTTLLHEAGHFFGLDDDALGRAGLG